MQHIVAAPPDDAHRTRRRPRHAHLVEHAAGECGHQLGAAPAARERQRLVARLDEARSECVDHDSPTHFHLVGERVLTSRAKPFGLGTAGRKKRFLRTLQAIALAHVVGWAIFLVGRG